jgi:lysozyme
VKSPRTAVAGLVVSAATLVGIALHESYKGEAYLPTKDDVPTIGFGTTEGVKMGDKITPERALVRLLADADKHAQAVKRCAHVPMYQHEFDAYTSFVYNVGEGAFCNSTLVKKLNAFDYEGACKELLRWDRQNGKVLRGLTIRRQAEYKQCSGES